MLEQQPVVDAAASFVKLFVEFPKAKKQMTMRPAGVAALARSSLFGLSLERLGPLGLSAGSRPKVSQQDSSKSHQLDC